MNEAQAIREAFDRILRADFPSARRALAQAQRDHYGMKPYQPGFPPVDAIGDQVVYKDASGFRFTVHDVHLDGSHIRRLLDGGVDRVRFFESWAREAKEAARIGLQHGMKDPQLEAKYKSSVSIDGFVVLRYEYTRGSLD